MNGLKLVLKLPKKQPESSADNQQPVADPSRAIPQLSQPLKKRKRPEEGQPHQQSGHLQPDPQQPHLDQEPVAFKKLQLPSAGKEPSQGAAGAEPGAQRPPGPKLIFKPRLHIKGPWAAAHGPPSGAPAPQQPSQLPPTAAAEAVPVQGSYPPKHKHKEHKRSKEEKQARKERKRQQQQQQQQQQLQQQQQQHHHQQEQQGQRQQSQQQDGSSGQQQGVAAAASNGPIRIAVRLGPKPQVQQSMQQQKQQQQQQQQQQQRPAIGLQQGSWQQMLAPPPPKVPRKIKVKGTKPQHQRIKREHPAAQAIKAEAPSLSIPVTRSDGLGSDSVGGIPSHFAAATASTSSGPAPPQSEVAGVGSRGAQSQGPPRKPDLERVIDRVQKKDPFEIFKEVPSDEVAPGYSSVVKQPMAFSLIRRKVEAGEYTNWDLLQADMETMFNNAMIYNTPDTVYHKQARTLLGVANKLIELGRKGVTDFRGRYANIVRQHNAQIAAEQKVESQQRRATGRAQKAAARAAKVARRAAASGVDISLFEKGRRAGEEEDEAEEGEAGGVGARAGGPRPPAVLDENVRFTYHPRVRDQNLAKWKVLAEGANAEGVLYANGRPVLKPVAGSLPADAYALSLLRFGASLRGRARHLLMARVLQCVPPEPPPAPAAPPLMLPSTTGTKATQPPAAAANSAATSAAQVPVSAPSVVPAAAQQQTANAKPVSRSSTQLPLAGSTQGAASQPPAASPAKTAYAPSSVPS